MSWAVGADFSIKKWDLKGEYLSEYAQHHSAVKSLCLVNEGYGKPMQMWSTSNKSEISQCKVFDDLVEHDIVGEVKVCQGWSNTYKLKFYHQSWCHYSLSYPCIELIEFKKENFNIETLVMVLC